MDSLAAQILSSPAALALLVLASPTIGLGAYVGYEFLRKIRKNGANGLRPNGELPLSRTEFYARTDAIREDMIKHFDRGLEAIETAISALRKEHGAIAHAHGHTRERLAALEAEVAQRGEK